MYNDAQTNSNITCFLPLDILVLPCTKQGIISKIYIKKNRDNLEDNVGSKLSKNIIQHPELYIVAYCSKYGQECFTFFVPKKMTTSKNRNT